MWINSTADFHKEHASNPNLPSSLFPEDKKKQKQAELIYKNSFNEDEHLPNLIKWTEKVFKELKEQNKIIAFFSSKNKENIERIMNHYQLSKYIDLIIWRSCVNKNKPEPEWFSIIINHFKKKQKELLMIWDSYSDYEASKKWDIDFLWVNSGICSKDEWNKLQVCNIASIKDLI